MTAPMTDAEIREALARAERATCSCHIEITRVHGFPQGHRSDCARTDVPRLAADLLAARAERDEFQKRLVDVEVGKETIDAVNRAETAERERDEARAAHESERRVYGEDVRINAARAEAAEARCRELEGFVRGFLHASSGTRNENAAALLSRFETRAQVLLSPPPRHTCQIHRATSGASDCGLSPCEEATVHTDRGEARTATVRRAVPAVAEKHGQYCPKNPDATIRHMVDFCTCGPTPAESATHEDEMERMCRENREAMAARYGPNWDCKTCGGSGRVVRDNGINPVHGEPVEIEEPCPDCHGCGGAK